jgi:type I restriction enzyme S subunit
MRSDVPQGWKFLKAGEVFDLEYGKPLPATERSGQGFPVYGSNGVVGYHDSALVRGPGIVVGRKGSAGSIHWAKLDFSPIDTTYYVRPQELADLTWLYFSLLAFDLPSLTEATGIPGLNRNVVAQQKLLLPPLAEQRKIAAILTSVDEAIQATEAVIAQTRRVKEGLLQELLTKGIGHTRFKQTEIGEIPEGWEVKRLEALLIGRPRNGLSPKTSETGLPTFSIAAVRDGAVDINNNLKYTGADTEASEPFRVKSGDILLVRGNANPEFVASAGMVSDFPPGCIYPDLLMRLSPNATVIAEFLLASINAPIGHNQLLLKAKTTNGTLKVNGQDVCSTQLPVPPRDEQDAIMNIFASVNDCMESARTELRCLMATKSGLLQDLLTGRVRVTS